MVVQKTIDNLKQSPKDEKTVVAGGVAITVVVILLIAWGFFFFKKIQRGAQLQIGNASQDEFNFQSVRDAQRQLQSQQNAGATSDELQAIHDESVSARLQGQQPNSLQKIDATGGGGGDQFGTPGE